MENHHKRPKGYPDRSTTISPEEAIARTATWRAFIAQHTGLPENMIPRGVHISMDDIIQLSRDPRFNNGNVSGVRAYFTCANGDTPDHVTEISLVFVPIDQNGHDILVISTPGGEDVSMSAVEDFTKPCPSACDLDSPLYKDPR